MSAIVFCISLFGAILKPSFLYYFFYLLASFSIIVFSIFFILQYQFIKKKALFSSSFNAIRLYLSKFELASDNIEEILSLMQRFNENYDKKSNELQEFKRKLEIKKDKIKELKEVKIPGIKNKIKNILEKINLIKSKSEEESLEEYTKKLILKSQYERSIKEQESILNSLFDSKSKILKENINFWTEEIEKLKEYEDKAESINFNETSFLKLNNQKNEFENNLNILNQKLKDIQNEMNEIGKKANEVLHAESESIYCTTTIELEELLNRLQEFINKTENNRENALEGIKIFEEIEAEEKEKVSVLFGKNSPASKFFAEITGNFYEEVIFSQENDKIKVRRQNGEVLEAEKLSGGAWDQLYFSIRLALGEKLLKGSKGFFILDDPFIKSDPIRLEKQINMLQKIIDKGWQILYFSSKGEIKEIFNNNKKYRNVNYIEI